VVLVLGICVVSLQSLLLVLYKSAQVAEGITNIKIHILFRFIIRQIWNSVSLLLDCIIVILVGTNLSG
jgi:hypothetical protein